MNLEEEYEEAMAHLRAMVEAFVNRQVFCQLCFRNLVTHSHDKDCAWLKAKQFLDTIDGAQAQET